jgi:hypothetical protein
MIRGDFHILVLCPRIWVAIGLIWSIRYRMETAWVFSGSGQPRSLGPTCGQAAFTLNERVSCSAKPVYTVSHPKLQSIAITFWSLSHQRKKGIRSGYRVLCSLLWGIDRRIVPGYCNQGACPNQELTWNLLQALCIKGNALAAGECPNVCIACRPIILMLNLGGIKLN